MLGSISSTPEIELLSPIPAPLSQASCVTQEVIILTERGAEVLPIRGYYPTKMGQASAYPIEVLN